MPAQVQVPLRIPETNANQVVIRVNDPNADYRDLIANAIRDNIPEGYQHDVNTDIVIARGDGKAITIPLNNFENRLDTTINNMHTDAVQTRDRINALTDPAINDMIDVQESMEDMGVRLRNNDRILDSMEEIPEENVNLDELFEDRFHADYFNTNTERKNYMTGVPLERPAVTWGGTPYVQTPSSGGGGSGGAGWMIIIPLVTVSFQCVVM